MALNIKLHNGLFKTNRLEHHRNPSGLNNKINYLLVESKRDIDKLNKLKNDIVIIKSWSEAFDIAEKIIRYKYMGRIQDFREMYDMKETLLFGLETKIPINRNVLHRSKTRHIVTGIRTDKKKQHVKLYWTRFIEDDDDDKPKEGVLTVTYNEFMNILLESINSSYIHNKFDKLTRDDIRDMLDNNKCINRSNSEEE